LFKEESEGKPMDKTKLEDEKEEFFTRVV